MKYVEISAYILTLSWFCSTCAIGRLNVTSTPLATEVTLVNGRGEISSLGKTPVQADMNQIFSSGVDFVHIKLSKEGFFPQSFILSRTGMPSNHNISMSLEEKPAKIEPILPPIPAPVPVAIEIDKCEQLSKESLNKLSQGVATVQSIILKREYEVAKVRLSTMISDFPYISVLYDLQGNIYFMQRNYVEALRSYEKSLELEPQNVETGFIVKKLHQQLGRSN